MDVDPPINETVPTLDEVKEAVASLRDEKAAGIYNISVKFLKTGGEAIICELHDVLTAIWHSGIIHHEWKRALVVPIWKGKGDH